MKTSTNESLISKYQRMLGKIKSRKTKIESPEELVDKLLIHLSQSNAYSKERPLEKTLYHRFASQEETKEDVKCLEWAIDWLMKKNLYIKEKK